MTPPSKPPFQFSLAAMFGLMAVVSIAVWGTGQWPVVAILLAYLSVIALAFAAWIGVLTGITAAAVWLVERLCRLVKNR